MLNSTKYDSLCDRWSEFKLLRILSDPRVKVVFIWPLIKSVGGELSKVSGDYQYSLYISLHYPLYEFGLWGPDVDVGWRTIYNEYSLIIKYSNATVGINLLCKSRNKHFDPTPSAIGHGPQGNRDGGTDHLWSCIYYKCHYNIIHDRQTEYSMPSTRTPCLFYYSHIPIPTDLHSKRLRPHNLDLLQRPIRRIRLRTPNPIHNTHTIHNLSKYSMLSIQMRCGAQTYEELRPIGPRARVSLQIEVQSQLPPSRKTQDSKDSSRVQNTPNAVSYKQNVP